MTSTSHDMEENRSAAKLYKRAVCPIRNNIQLRWMIRRDWERVFRIEKECFQFPNEKSRCKGHLEKQSCICEVAEFNGEVVGFIAYEVNSNFLRILDIAVTPSMRLNSAGTMLLNRLKNNLTQQWHPTIRVNVCETNLGGQLFLKKSGFKAIAITRNTLAHEQTGYEFEYRQDGNLRPLGHSDMPEFEADE